MIRFATTRMIAVGEAMIEMAETGEGTYRKSFAGDTFNTAWHISQIPGADVPVSFVTTVGTDPVSAAFIAELQADGLDTAHIGRVPERTMGLYMIELDETERSFHYWRDTSAARLLAADEDVLVRSMADAGVIHVSGITLAILQPADRRRLISALSTAREQGARVSFDPNVRPRLWSSPRETQDSIAAMLAVTDIALPSFDDEAALWGDTAPRNTIARLRAAGVSEIVVKNGPAPVTSWDGEQVAEVPCKPVAGIRDTSGAGDAFNAGYLAARLAGLAPISAIASGQKMSGAVLQYFGARIPAGHVPGLVMTAQELANG